jgi:hypothetical protein
MNFISILLTIKTFVVLIVSNLRLESSKMVAGSTTDGSCIGSWYQKVTFYYCLRCKWAKYIKIPTIGINCRENAYY